MFYICIGKSTHNQRIERLWRDVFAGCLTLFYNLFYELERSGTLNPNDDIHLWCLHYTFLPVINRHLKNWKNAWVHHPLRSERNATPMQLWIRGLNSIWGSESTIDREVFQVNVHSFFVFCIILLHQTITVKWIWQTKLECANKCTALQCTGKYLTLFIPHKKST